MNAYFDTAIILKLERQRAVAKLEGLTVKP